MTFVKSVVDPTVYITYKNPESYHTDWRGFYDRALTRREAMTTRMEPCKYGPDAAHLANVHYDPARSECPVVVFFHGGRWREGHPDLYDHFAAPWVEMGAVFVSCGYRLTPDHSIADAIDDAGTALRWIRSQCSDFGGNPARITAAGHSSGGHIAAMATLTDWSPNPVEVETVVAMSSPTDLRERFAGDPSAADISPSLRVTRSAPTVIVSFGSPELNNKAEEPTFYATQGGLLGDALVRIGCTPTLIDLGEVNHIESASALVDPSSPLFTAVHSAVFSH